MQEWHGARDMGVRNKTKMVLQKEPRRDETSGESGRQQWNKEPRPKEAAASRKREDIQRDLLEDFQDGDHKANSWIFCNKDWTLWRGQSPPKWKKSLIAALAQEEPEMWDYQPLLVICPHWLEIRKKKGMRVVPWTDLKEGAR